MKLKKSIAICVILEHNEIPQRIIDLAYNGIDIFCVNSINTDLSFCKKIEYVDADKEYSAKLEKCIFLKNAFEHDNHIIYDTVAIVNDSALNTLNIEVLKFIDVKHNVIYSKIEFNCVYNSLFKIDKNCIICDSITANMFGNTIKIPGYHNGDMGIELANVAYYRKLKYEDCCLY